LIAAAIADTLSRNNFVTSRVENYVERDVRVGPAVNLRIVNFHIADEREVATRAGAGL
jgi:hypothetical protein